MRKTGELPKKTAKKKTGRFDQKTANDISTGQVQNILNFILVMVQSHNVSDGETDY